MSSINNIRVLFSRKATQQSPKLRGPGAAERVAVRVSELNHSYGSGELAKQVLFDNHLELARGEIVIMTGPSGSGKTTLLTLIGALRTVQNGSLRVAGHELSGMNSSERVDVRRNIGFIFQAHNLFGSLTAFQNVRMSLELSGLDPGTMKSRVEQMLETLGLGHRIHYKPDSLSGGQRQRVAIARALVGKPKIILADEPTAALDKKSGRDVVDLLRKFAREEQSTILMVTHDNRILDVADRIVNMVDGRIISDVVVSEAAAICEFLRRIELFSKLTPSTLADVADNMTLEQHPAGDVIIRQGDQGDKFYLIRNGNAEVVVETSAGRKKVATLGEGDFFGEAALISGEPRNASVVARDETELCVLGKDDFQGVMEASASFKEELRKVLFERQ